MEVCRLSLIMQEFLRTKQVRVFSLRLKEQAERAGIEIAMEKVVEADLSGAVKRIVAEGTTYEAKAVIIAAGTTPRKLGIPGEDTFCGTWNRAESGKRCKEVRRQRSICCGRSRRSGERSAFFFRNLLLK